MKIKDLYNVLDRKHCYVYTIEDGQYKTLASLNVSGNDSEYYEECKKLRELAKANDYTVKDIMLLDGSSPCIAIELVKDGE